MRKRAKTTTKKPAGADAAEPEPATNKKPAGADAAKSSSRAYDDHRGAKAKSKAKSKAGNAEQANQQAMTKPPKKNKNDNFVQAMTKQYIGEPPEEMQNQPPKTLRGQARTTSGARSGTGMAEPAPTEAMSRASARFRADPIREKAEGKREFLGNIVLPHCGASRGCVFEDLLELPTGPGQCALHGGTAENNDMRRAPRAPDLFTCGFSCKDLSDFFTSDFFTCGLPAEERANILGLGPGTSGGPQLYGQYGARGPNAATGHAARAKPSVIILENVDGMTKRDSPDVRYLWGAFEGVYIYNIFI
jgi:hypothetical protein